MTHPLSEFTKDLQALELELRLHRTSGKPGPKAWAHSLLEECSQDLLSSPKAMMAAFKRVQVENPNGLQAVISVFLEFLKRLAPRVNEAWESENPIGELLKPRARYGPFDLFTSPRKRRNEFQRRGRYAL